MSVPLFEFFAIGYKHRDIRRSAERRNNIEFCGAYARKQSVTDIGRRSCLAFAVGRKNLNVVARKILVSQRREISVSSLSVFFKSRFVIRTYLRFFERFTAYIQKVRDDYKSKRINCHGYIRVKRRRHRRHDQTRKGDDSRMLSVAARALSKRERFPL